MVEDVSGCHRNVVWLRLPPLGRGFWLVELVGLALGYVTLGRALVEPAPARRTRYVVRVLGRGWWGEVAEFA